MENYLVGKKIVLGVTASIAAYKAPSLVRDILKNRGEARVIMTPSAVNFVAPLTLENLSRHPVAIDMFSKETQSGGAWHIQLAHWADAMIIAPCSATTIAKIAHGICDNSLITVSLALPPSIPLIIAPAMDTTMWNNPVTQRNVKILKADGRIIIPPEEGELSSGMTGPGRLPSNDVLIDYLNNIFKWTDSNSRLNFQYPETEKVKDDVNDNVINVIVEKPREKTYEEKLKEALSKPSPTLEEAVDEVKWATEFEMTKLKQKVYGTDDYSNLLRGKRVLITAGPTYEKIDEVRFIGNFSSGKMGYSLAMVAKMYGADDVVLVSGPVSLETPADVRRIDVQSANDMYNVVTSEFANTDIAILSAAVADYTPKTKYEGKLKKEDTGDNLEVELVKTVDILSELGAKKLDSQVVVGFALEYENEIENGWKKLKSKNADFIVVNSVGKPSSGFGTDDNTITILSKNGNEQKFQPMSKVHCAHEILKAISGK